MTAISENGTQARSVDHGTTPGAPAPVVPTGSGQEDVRHAIGKLGGFDVTTKTAVLNFVPEKDVGVYYY